MIEMEPKGITSVLGEVARMTASLNLTPYKKLYGVQTLSMNVRSYCREIETATDLMRGKPLRRRRSLEYVENLTKAMIYLILLDMKASDIVLDSLTDGEIHETIMNAIGEIRCGMRNLEMAYFADPSPAATTTSTKEG